MRTLIFVLLLAINYPAQGVEVSTDSQPNTDEVRRVLAVEDEYVAAEIDRDEVVLRRIVDDSFVLNSNRGTVSGKEELIQAILNWNMTSQKITERTAVVDGGTAIICGTAELSFASEGEADRVSLLRYTSTYIQRHGEWRFLALHMARRETQ